jgi:hypothetical protein
MIASIGLGSSAVTGSTSVTFQPATDARCPQIGDVSLHQREVDPGLVDAPSRSCQGLGGDVDPGHLPAPAGEHIGVVVWPSYREPEQQLAAELRGALGAEPFEIAWEAGRALSPSQALHVAAGSSDVSAG